MTKTKCNGDCNETPDKWSWSLITARHLELHLFPSKILHIYLIIRSIFAMITATEKSRMNMLYINMGSIVVELDAESLLS